MTALASRTEPPTLEQIQRLEAEMLKVEQVSCGVVHRFGPGVYMREVTIPADTFSIGHHQNFEHTNIMLKGHVTMIHADGSRSDVKAPAVFVAPPGRKIGYIHEEMVWVNVYATDETDIEKLEAIYLTKSDSWRESVKALESADVLKIELDRSDYVSAITEFGFAEKIVRAQSEDTSDQVALPFGAYKIKVAASKIEGKGLIAMADIAVNEIIAPARISGKRTIAGRYTNHSKHPNARMCVLSNGDIDLVAIAPITGCHGGLDGEEITTDYRETIRGQI